MEECKFVLNTLLDRGNKRPGLPSHTNIDTHTKVVGFMLTLGFKLKLILNSFGLRSKVLCRKNLLEWFLKFAIHISYTYTLSSKFAS